jgi:hypothetical protein
MVTAHILRLAVGLTAINTEPYEFVLMDHKRTFVSDETYEQITNKTKQRNGDAVLGKFNSHSVGQNFLIFYVTGRFMATFTRGHHWSLS